MINKTFINTKDFAHHLRLNQTDAEKFLWAKLRGKRLSNYRFRRQQRIGIYIVDFVCFLKKLIIEVDGGQHSTDKGKIKDKVRTEWLQKEGYSVLRFWDNQVLNEIDSVVEKIYLTLVSMESRHSLSSDRRGLS